jgi:protein-S-isoprenylcysteine O-methyltransferase Ste14
MKDYSFNTDHGEQPIITGYVGAATIVILSIAIALLKLGSFPILGFNVKEEYLLLLMVIFSFISMLIAEHFSRRHYVENGWIKVEKIKNKKTDIHLLISTLYRFSTLLLIFYLMSFIVNNHYYFSDDSFQITREFFTYFLVFYLFLGIPYIFFTLRYKSSFKYEFNDYAINLMLVSRGAIYFSYGFLFHKHYFLRRSKVVLLSKKVKKIILTYLIIFFFLTLMLKFLNIEFSEFHEALSTIFLNQNSTFFDRYNAWYLMLYHLLFTIDVSLGIIGYTIASRWLDNRTRSVDMTMEGWIVALMCYPPMNNAFTEQFINYNRLGTHAVITSELGKMIVMAFTLLLIIIYVWATIAFSFKFSNLTNRGIVTTGPYAVVRHPAYVAKNLSWWLANTFVLSNFWAASALFAWNVIYILRALTEEKHLKKDPKYQAYCNKVKYRFIPGLI